jgi:DNA-3-methyladenine glycosylase II
MNKTQIKKGLDAIASVDKHVARALDMIGYPKPRLRPAGFETFLETIVSQQISVKAAASILARVKALLPVCEADSLLAVSNEQLRAAGLSQRKVEYLQGLARAIIDGLFDPEALHDMDDESAIESIVRLRGFGRWSAEIYLMFSLGRPDIFPADDLILQVSLQKVKRLRTKPTPKVARQKVEHWGPWRSVGSLFLWHYHHSTLPVK